MLIVIILIILAYTSALNIANAGVASGDIGGTTQLTDPLGGKDVNTLIGQVINAALGVVGSIALAMFIYGGFTWMLSGGNSQNVEKGKGILIWATVGLVVIFASYAMVHFVFNKILGLS